MRAFVTGGAGFIGSHLVDLLRAEGHGVVILLKPGEATTHLAPEAETVTADIMDRDALLDVTPPCDVVFHLAARTDLAGVAPDDYAANTRGTANVIEAAEQAGASRIVVYSSMLAAALPPDGSPVDESFAAAPTTAYGQSKLESERLAAAGPVPWTVIRPTFVYGPRERSTLFAMLRAIAAKRFALIGKDAPQSYCYVGNLVRATLDAARHPDAAGRLFLISDARPYPLGEFAGAAAGAMGRRLPRLRLPKPAAYAIAYPLGWMSALTGRAVPLFPSRVRTMTAPYVYSIDRARRVFGYDPPDDLPRFMQETVAEAVQAGDLKGR
ncbi:MAG: NAD-dependent epimerase/dehydratase family protein [Planctomycetota bacterium]|jgi:nucleoside-diphosphate-sugar epimerase